MGQVDSIRVGHYFQYNGITWGFEIMERGLLKIYHPNTVVLHDVGGFRPDNIIIVFFGLRTEVGLHLLFSGTWTLD